MDKKEMIRTAVALAFAYGGIDGGQHKMWVIDQMVRTLMGDEYETFVKVYEDDDEYEWDTGIMP